MSANAAKSSRSLKEKGAPKAAIKIAEETVF